MENLKPCPFCGGKARLIKGDVCWVKCDYCGAETAAETSTTEAIAAWNRRGNDEQAEWQGHLLTRNDISLTEKGEHDAVD